MCSLSLLKQLIENLTPAQREYLKDLFIDIHRKANNLQSYPDAMTEILRTANYTRALSDDPIKECSQENAAIMEVNDPITVLREVQEQLNKLLELSAAESIERKNAICKKILADLGLD
jgi:hypothetical protein